VLGPAGLYDVYHFSRNSWITCSGKEAEVDLGGGQSIVAEEPLEGGKGDALLDREKACRSTWGVTGRLTVTIIDGPRRIVLGTLKAPRPHGLAVLVHSP
jgi:hypothetical protein